MNPLNISIDEAKPDKLFYVVANIIIVDRAKAACLLLKRGDNEKVYPGKWAFPGGKLEHGEVKQMIIDSNVDPLNGIDDILGKLASREAKEECGLEVKEESQIVRNKVFIRPDGIPVLLVIVLSEYSGGQVAIEDGAISDFAWVTKERVDNYDCIDDVKDEVRLALG